MVGTLVDRAAETGALEGVLAAVRDGLSGVLVLRGEAGIGKTALLDWAAGQAAGLQVTRLAGVETEMDLGFAGLHQLLVPFLGGLGELPGPQRQALGSAFGLSAGPPPDRFLVGLAALTLVTDAAAGTPVLCLVDDAQWLDRVSVEVLGFVARRLLADRVGMVFAVRTGEQRAVPLEGLPELRVGVLADEAAAQLLASSLGRAVEEQVARRVVTEAAGNPLALVEFGGELTDAELSGAEPLRGPLRFGGRVEQLYRSRVRALPEQARLLLLVAAADDLGDPATVWRAAGQLGLGADMAELPAVERLVSWAPQVAFRHPLVRSAAYYAAPVTARRRAHEALAAVTDPGRDPDRRAWHLAEAARGPDEQVAAGLEESAGRARARGGWASGAAFLERAAALTPDAGRRAHRLLAAAEARLAAGEAPAARVLAGQAAPHLADPPASAKARRLEGLTLYAAGQLPEAVSALLDAAAMLQPSDPRLARDTLLDAFAAAQLSHLPEAGITQVLAAADAAPPVPESEASVADWLLDGFAAVAEHRYLDGAALLRRAVAPPAAGQPIPDDVLPLFPAISSAAGLLFDDAARHQLERRWVAELRDRGALAALLAALLIQVAVQAEEGRFADAETSLAEGRDLSEATGYRAYLTAFAFTELVALAWQGREAVVRSLAARLLPESAGPETGYPALAAHFALARLELGLGNYADALRHALQARPARRVLPFDWPIDIVEAGTRCGDRDAAAAELAAFAPWALAAGTHLALGALARCRALLADDDDAEPEYRLSVEHLRQTRIAPELARSHLLHGEWLRRQRRRRDARDQLGTAAAMFEAMGMAAFAARARAELRATGERARPRGPASRDDALTPQEGQIAALAGEGLSNKEIAAQLFISAATVEYHLHKVFRKLDLTSRVQLARALTDQDGAGGV